MAKISTVAQIEGFGLAAANVLMNMALKAGTESPLYTRMGMVGFLTQCGRMVEATAMLNRISADILKGEL